MTHLRTLRRKTSVTVEAHYRLDGGSTEVMAFGNSHKTWRDDLRNADRPLPRRLQQRVPRRLVVRLHEP